MGSLTLILIVITIVSIFTGCDTLQQFNIWLIAASLVTALICVIAATLVSSQERYIKEGLHEDSELPLKDSDAQALVDTYVRRYHGLSFINALLAFILIDFA